MKHLHKIFVSSTCCSIECMGTSSTHYLVKMALKFGLVLEKKLKKKMGSRLQYYDVMVVVIGGMLCESL